jgi:hypothetical protein
MCRKTSLKSHENSYCRLSFFYTQSVISNKSVISDTYEVITTRSSVIYTRRVISTRTRANSTRKRLFSARIVRFSHAKCAFYTRDSKFDTDCDFDTHEWFWECDFVTYECDFDTYKWDLYSQSVISIRIVILTSTNVTMTLTTVI